MIRIARFSLMAAGILFVETGMGAAPADTGAAPGRGLPPLIVEPDAPRLRGPATEPPAASQRKSQTPVADNSTCYVCHVNLREDSFTQDHAHANIGCVDCHGKSAEHVADEANLTPPDIMYSAGKIAPLCGECHSTHDAPATAVLARWQERCAGRTNVQAVLCTDCHGTHRFLKRSIVWNKETRQLIRGGRARATAAGSQGAASLTPAFGKALTGGLVVEGRAEYRKLPITVECWARLDSQRGFNILVASDPKASAEHWELYSFAGNGTFSVYQPGRGGNVSSEVNICDGRWHYLAAILEPERVRLFVDGQLVKDAPAKPLNGRPVPGGVAFGRLVEGGIGCDGAVDDVRLSGGVREIVGVPKEPFRKDERTIGLWHFDELAATTMSPPGAPPAALPPPPDVAPPGSLFARTNLVAWCIVPFDTKKRGPEERAAMLESLGIKKLAYDWRAEHIPTFDAEVAAMKRHGVEMTAWWFPGALNAEARAILDCIKRNHIHPQLWVTFEGGPHLRLDKAFESTPEAQAAHVERMVAAVKPIAAEAAKLGCQVALYNHGGWFGVPENQIQIVKRLKQDGVENVGMVYTQHHGHGDVDRFAELFPKMKPYLLAITLNGMIKDGDLRGHNFGTVPLGQGDQDVRLLRIIKESGWKGPVGIILEVNADADARLRDNLDGLAWLLPQLDGKPPGPKPTPRTWHPRE